MRHRAYNLAIETSGRIGSVTLGKMASDGPPGGQIVASTTMPEQRRHTVDLMPTIDRLAREHGVTPTDLAEVYVSIGPGSFTGLRIGIATAKMLALSLGARLVGVPTLDVLAHNAPPEIDCVATCLNLKRDTVYANVFRREADGWQPLREPSLTTMDELLWRCPRPVGLIGDPLPPLPENGTAGATLLPPTFAHARSEIVWKLGRSRAERNAFTPEPELLPLYVRQPEAVELWNQREAKR